LPFWAAKTQHTTKVMTCTTPIMIKNR
jgi:hypothetical protein